VELNPLFIRSGCLKHRFWATRPPLFQSVGAFRLRCSYILASLLDKSIHKKNHLITHKKVVDLIYFRIKLILTKNILWASQRTLFFLPLNRLAIRFTTCLVNGFTTARRRGTVAATPAIRAVDTVTLALGIN